MVSVMREAALKRNQEMHFYNPYMLPIANPSQFFCDKSDGCHAIELAWVRDWQPIQLEVDSSFILDFIKPFLLVLWKLHISWFNCSYLTSLMIFVFHIFSVKEIRWSMFQRIMVRFLLLLCDRIYSLVFLFYRIVILIVQVFLYFVFDSSFICSFIGRFSLSPPKLLYRSPLNKLQ